MISTDNINLGPKITSYGRDINNPRGKDGVKALIKDVILNNNLHYWVEVSDGVERCFKNLNGYPMPNFIAKDLLNKKDLELLQDGIHYKRTIGLKNPVEYTKMIYGIPSKEIFDTVISQLNEDYPSFRARVNSIKEMKVKQGFGLNYFLTMYNKIQDIDDYIIEENINEAPKEWINELIDYSIELSNESSDDDNIAISKYICNRLLDTLEPLELHELKM